MRIGGESPCVKQGGACKLNRVRMAYGACHRKQYGDAELNCRDISCNGKPQMWCRAAVGVETTDVGLKALE